jgi:hypothetical protein
MAGSFGINFQGSKIEVIFRISAEKKYSSCLDSLVAASASQQHSLRRGEEDGASHGRGDPTTKDTIIDGIDGGECRSYHLS